MIGGLLHSLERHLKTGEIMFFIQFEKVLFTNVGFFCSFTLVYIWYNYYRLFQLFEFLIIFKKCGFCCCCRRWFHQIQY